MVRRGVTTTAICTPNTPCAARRVLHAVPEHPQLRALEVLWQQRQVRLQRPLGTQKSLSNIRSPAASGDLDRHACAIAPCQQSC